MWGLILPVAVHFLIGQVLSYGALWLLRDRHDQIYDSYMGMVMALTGLTGLLATILLLPMFVHDERCRRVGGLRRRKLPLFTDPWESILLIGTGAGLSQYLNIFMALISGLLPASDYSETMELIERGQSLAAMIFFMGILAPVAEEVIFRWILYLRLRDRLTVWPSVLISAALFGIYHGDVLQGTYAGIMGIFLALIMEYSGSLTGSILIHAGANTWGILLPELVYGEMNGSEQIVLALSVFWLCCMTAACYLIRNKRAGDGSLC